jgi:hypothetical protein
MEYSREEWEEMFPGEPYPLDNPDEDIRILSLIRPPEKLEEDE